MRTLMKYKTLPLALLALMAVAVILVGCPPQQQEDVPPMDATPPVETTAPTGEAIKIGGIFDTSGAASALGEPEANTAMMLQEKINAEGGIDGRPVEIVIRDTKGDEVEGLTVTKELIEKENVVAIVGPSRSGTTMAIVDYIESAEVPLVSCAAARAITDPVKKWVFNTPQSDEDAVTKIFGYCNAQGIAKIATITASSGFGIEGLKQLEKLAPGAGIEIVGKEEFADSDKDMVAQLTKIKNGDAQAVICWGIGPAPSLIAKQANELGFEIPVIMSHGVANQRFIEGAGEGAEGVILPAGKLLVADQLPDDDPHKELLVQYAADYEAKYDKAADTFGGHAWDAVMVVVNAIKENGVEPAQIRDGVESTTDFAGIGGTFNFSADSHYGLSPDAFVMITIQDGEWTLLDAASADDAATDEEPTG